VNTPNTPHHSAPTAAPRHLAARALIILGAGFALAACSADGTNSAPNSAPSSSQRNTTPASLARDAGASARSSSPSTPSPAIVAGQRVEWGPLHDRLAEAAGALVLEELALDAALEAELARRGVVVTDAMVRAEDAILLAAIQADARMTPDRAQRALADLRQREGLGPVRYEDLLRRNARLRALAVANAPQRLAVRDDEATTAAELAVGGRVRARILVVDSDRDAARHRDRIAAMATPASGGPGGGPPATPISDAFATVAREVSRDPSASRGGLIEDVSPADPVVPVEVRRLLRTLTPGQLSEVVAADQGRFAVVLVESRTSGGIASPDDLAAARQRLTRRKERVVMDEIATRLLAESRVTVFDPSLRWSWERARE
jgi:hypothetical protein